jgi:hypothetical protein
MGRGAGVDRMENLAHAGIRSPRPSISYLVATHNVVQRKSQLIAKLYGSLSAHRILVLLCAQYLINTNIKGTSPACFGTSVPSSGRP